MKFYIYKIYSKDKPDFYIGSTNDYSRRKSQHKKNCYNRVSKKYHFRLYRFIRENGGFDNFEFELLYEFECETFRDGRLKELEFVEKLNPSLNKIRPVKIIQDFVCKTIDELKEFNSDFVVEEKLENIKKINYII